MSDLDHARQMLAIARRDLTIFAVHFRYDDAGDDCGFPERDEVLEKVAGLVSHVEQVLS